MSASRQRARQALSVMLGLSLSVPLAAGVVTPALAESTSPSPEPTVEETPNPTDEPFTTEETEQPETSEAPSVEEDSDTEEAEETLQSPQQETTDSSGVVVSVLTNGGPNGYHDNFIEITNTSDEAVDVSGWEVYRCTGGGSRASGSQTTLEGEIEAGEIILLAREFDNTPFSDEEVDYRYGTSFANNSYGAMILDDKGETVDSVAAKDAKRGGGDCGVSRSLA